LVIRKYTKKGGVSPHLLIYIPVMLGMNRRDFLISSCAICGGAALGISLLEGCKKTSVESPQNVNFKLDLSTKANSALNSKGGSLTQDSVVVICTGPSAFIALSAICTHQGCTVAYNSSRNELICPCHGGTYNISGAVVSGPPPGSLASYKTSLSGNILTVTS
jgi:cytochrome b6-f complex iron-sulfur subunit